MSELERYRAELRFVFDEAEQEIDGLPDGLRERALELLTRSDPSRNGGRANAISYLLPYWMREMTDGSIETCRDLAIGNIYAMLRFFLLDDAMDGGGPGPEEARRSLALVPLLDELFLGRYRRHFPSESPLWGRYRAYVAEWAAAVASEGKRPADPRAASVLAAKAAPVKICVYGMLLREGALDRLPAAEEAVELALAVLQLSDDRADWQEDLPDANRNAFLTIVRERLPAEPGEPSPAPDEAAVRRAIHHGGALDRLADIAAGYVERAARIPGAPERVVAFARDIASGMERDARAAREAKRRLAEEGGFSYFLSKIEEI